ncbi:MAG: hypothetical protein EA397_14260 [Deltaproteobacteria bacterium]|nr:MAG: hypothetical protein EA397_14260 [Deltaproteobacteria bacterium]
MPPALLSLLALLAASPAFAQEGVNAHGFNMTAQDGDIRDPLTVERPGRMHAGDGYATALVEYGRGHMDQVIRDAVGNPGTRFTYLDHLTGVNLGAGISPHRMLRLDVRMPVFFAAYGFDPDDPDGQPIGGGLGSMRAAAMFAPVQPGANGGFGLGVVPWLDLPTATASKNFGYGGFAGGTKLAATYEAGPLTLTADAGLALRPTIEGFETLQGGPQLVSGLGVGLALTDNLGVNAEANLNPLLRRVPDVAGVPQWAESPGEALVSVRGRTKSGLHLLAGGAMALTRGVGAAQYRVFVGGGFGKISDPDVIGDRDGDGIADDIDQCPDEPETFNQYQDDDGCPDMLGIAQITATEVGQVVEGVEVTVSGQGQSFTVTTGAEPASLPELIPGMYDVRATDPRYDGAVQVRVRQGETPITLEIMPVKPGTLTINVRDEDGAPVQGALVTITVPNTEGEQALNADEEGLLSTELNHGFYAVFIQAEGFGIYREDVSIRSEATAEINAVLERPKTEVKDEKIEILERVFFEVGSATLQSRSHKLLNEIANIMLRNPDIALLEIAGHTSSEGSIDLNTQLSKDRAASVKQYLVDQGVAPDRLKPVGYGPSQPLVSEQTEADRAKNRRVEFNILEREK